MGNPAADDGVQRCGDSESGRYNCRLPWFVSCFRNTLLEGYTRCVTSPGFTDDSSHSRWYQLAACNIALKQFVPPAGITSAICSQWNHAHVAPCRPHTKMGRLSGLSFLRCLLSTLQAHWRLHRMKKSCSLLNGQHRMKRGCSLLNGHTSFRTIQLHSLKRLLCSMP